jgi:hypothetical protein
MRSLILLLHAMLLSLWLGTAQIAADDQARMRALSAVESNDRDHVKGKAGEVSRYQILPSIWRREGQSLRPTNPLHAATVVRRIMTVRAARFRGIYGRLPTDFEFYVLWNAPAQMLDGYPVSKRVAARAQRFCNAVASASGGP